MIGLSQDATGVRTSLTQLLIGHIVLAGVQARAQGGCSPCGCTSPPKFWGPKISNSSLSSIATCLLPTCPNVQMLKLKPMTRPAHDCPVPTTACSLSRLLCCCVPIHLLIFNSTDSRLPDSPSFLGPVPCRCRGRPPTEARRPRASGRWP